MKRSSSERRAGRRKKESKNPPGYVRLDTVEVEDKSDISFCLGRAKIELCNHVRILPVLQLIIDSLYFTEKNKLLL